MTQPNTPAPPPEERAPKPYPHAHACPICSGWCVCAEWYDGLPCEHCASPSADATAGERDTPSWLGPERIRHVVQEDPKGCAVACLAMVSRRTYSDVKASLAHPAEVERGLSDHTVVWWLQNEGYFIRRSWPDGEHGKPIPTRGIAIALTHNEHWIVLQDGHPFDPARELPLAFYPIRQVIEVREASAMQSAASGACAECARLREALRDVVDSFDRWQVDPADREGISDEIDAARAALRAPSTQREEDR